MAEVRRAAQLLAAAAGQLYSLLRCLKAPVARAALCAGNLAVVGAVHGAAAGLGAVRAGGPGPAAGCAGPAGAASWEAGLRGCAGVLVQ